MIALVPNNVLLEGTLVYAGGRMVDEGLDLQTATYISLCCDARAVASDPLPAGTPRRGFWADAYDDDGEELGSMLWLLEDGKATTEDARRAELKAQDALAWTVRDGHVLAVATETDVTAQRDAIWMKVTYTLLNGQTLTLSPFKVS